ncbi:MAG: hypothetical protein H0T42_20375 [Deltaproteobacteria bacterium]|nr:hypothetical protein [Deltaproteobacteria bacterium]
MQLEYDEIWLTWDEQDHITLRRVQIRPEIKRPWAMVNKQAAEAKKSLDELVNPWADVHITITTERSKRRMLMPEDLKKCGGVFRCQEAALGTRTRDSYQYTYGRDWSKTEKITSSGRSVVRNDSKLGFGYEENIAGHRVGHDRARLTDKLEVYFTALPEPSNEWLEKLLTSGKTETRNGVPSRCGSDSGRAVCFSQEQCLDTFVGSVTDTTKGKIHLNSIEYSEVLEASSKPFPSGTSRTSSAIGSEQANGGSEHPAGITASAPDVNDVYARFRAVAMTMPAAAGSIRPTLYDQEGGGNSGGGPTPPGVCDTWRLPGQRTLCKIFKMEKTKEFAATYTSDDDVAKDDPVVESMFPAINPAAGYFTTVFAAIAPKHWRFVIALETARQQIMKKYGIGTWRKNEKCPDSKCTAREDQLGNLVESAFDRSSWELSLLIGGWENLRVPLDNPWINEHTAGCYSLPGTPRVELAVDSWRNTFTSAADWWKANDPTIFKHLTDVCGGESYCGECTCLYLGYKWLQNRPGWTVDRLGDAFAGVCTNKGNAAFKRADATYGAAIRKVLKF